MGETWLPTAGLSGQVFDGPASYVESWDLGFQQEAARIAWLPSITARRAALALLEAELGEAARARMERAVRRLWERR